MNFVERTMRSRLRYFVRINPPIFLGSNVGEYPQEFLYGLYKVLSAMGVTSREYRANLERYLKYGTHNGKIIGWLSRVI